MGMPVLQPLEKAQTAMGNPCKSWHGIGLGDASAWGRRPFGLGCGRPSSLRARSGAAIREVVSARRSSESPRSAHDPPDAALEACGGTKGQLLAPNALKNLDRGQDCRPAGAPSVSLASIETALRWSDGVRLPSPSPPSRSSDRLDRRAACVAGLVAELLFDPDELVVFRQAVRPG